MKRCERPALFTLAGLLAAILAVPTAEAASVTRGPYLQMGTPTSVVVRWRTDVATNSRVRYGPSPGSLTALVDDPASTTNHTVRVPSLSPGTTYYYSVGTTAETLAGNDANHFFLTAPFPGTPKPTRIWVLGDSGTADGNAQAVRDAYFSFTGTRHTDLWLMLGDNAYLDGTDAEYQGAVFDMYPQMLRKSVLWPTLGNHDGHTADSGTQTGPYYDIFSLPRAAEAGGLPSGTEAYYSFDHGNIHFIVLDSFDSDRSAGGAMLTWLAQDLLATTQDWIVAYWHHPPYSKGSHDSDTEIELVEMRQNALPILEEGGVDLVLAGHSHSYERSFLLDGHYGHSSTLVAGMVLDPGDGRPAGDGAYEKPPRVPRAGAVYSAAGSSGQTSGGPLNHPAMYLSLDVLGSLVLDVQGPRLDATFLDAAGATRDSFTIQKTPPPSPALRYYTLPPCRVVDTRLPSGPLGGPALAAGTQRVFTIAGACTVPASAKAVAVNATVTGPTSGGNLRLHSEATLTPLVSSVNYSPGQTRANNAIVPLSALGQMAVFCAQASGTTTHFILDVSGYFE